MEQPLVSIIIPVYKAEKYLRRCLKSVSQQTYKNIKVILVDDGSPDNCPQICNEYAAKDSRFHVIHKENGGISSARNAGLDYCEKCEVGGYICFLDDDDWLPLKSIELLCERLIKTDADMSWGGFTRILVSGRKETRCNNLEVYTEKKYELSKSLPCSVPPWAKLYKADIIIKEKIRFPVDVSINEDTIFVYTYLKYCKKIAFLSESTYYWSHINDNSYSRTFHEDINLSFAKALSIRCTLVNPCQSDPHEWEIVLELFHAALLSYVNSISPKQKIDETYRLFLPFLQGIDMQWLLNSSNQFASMYRSYCKYFEDGKIDFVLQVLQSFLKEDNTSQVKILVRNILLPLEQFFVFRLNLFYK